MQERAQKRNRRRKHIRKMISGNSDRPRLSVFRSAKHIMAQIINDQTGITLVAASSYEKNMKGIKGIATVEGAKRIGEAIAERAKAKGVEKVVFDRGGYLFHGRVKALAEAAREKGLKF
ncbi:MAG: 50S ribosomal protein L18 [Pseudomonadota bacterium]